jgi:hypothetical protein
MSSSITPHPPSLDRGPSLNSKLFASNNFQNSKGIQGLSNSINSHQQSDSFAIFSAVLKDAYQKIALAPQIPNANESAWPSETAKYELSDYNTVEKTSSKQAANNILNFISQRLRSDEANGAGPEQLLQRLDEGLGGFIKGFNEAKDIISGLGLITPELSNQINDTYERVTNGVERLRERITENAGQPVSELDAIVEVNQTDNLSSLELSAQVSESSSFSLSLITQDGDQVTIEISRSNAAEFSNSFSRSGSGTSLEINQQRSSSSEFSLNVIGALDDGELAAIDELLQSVNTIANDFYSGQFDQAFDLAAELKIDRDEFSSLNLQLQRTTTTRALASYQTNPQNELSSLSGSEQAQFNPANQLNQLLNNIQEVLIKAAEFDNPLKLVNDLSSGIEKIYQPQAIDANLTDKLNSLISQFYP